MILNSLFRLFWTVFTFSKCRDGIQSKFTRFIEGDRHWIVKRGDNVMKTYGICRNLSNPVPIPSFQKRHLFKICWNKRIDYRKKIELLNLGWKTSIEFAIWSTKQQHRLHKFTWKNLLCKVNSLLKSKFFPAKISFSKIQKKILAGKIYFAKDWIERDPIHFFGL